jgi:hypothetical protein
MSSNLGYEKSRRIGQAFYKSIGSIYSPALGENVRFSANGFNHILYRKSNNERDKSSQISRFKSSQKAVELVSISNTYQESEERASIPQASADKRDISKVKVVYYWGLVAILNGIKIKVVLRKVLFLIGAQVRIGMQSI